MIPKKLLDEISRWMDEKRYGFLQINFQEGKIVNLNINQSLKVESIGSSFNKVELIKSSSVDV